MGKARREQLDKVTFRCGSDTCRKQFTAVPTRIEPLPEQSFHPWEYFVACPVCGEEATQAWFERNLMKAHANATGPRTDAGKAIVAKNLEGHPTPEETKITRFNAIKHGLYTRATKYFPARPGQYASCEGCEFFGNGCGEISTSCLKQTEIFMQYDIAYSQKNPDLLRKLDTDMQATIRVIVNEMLLSIARRGVEWERAEWYYDKEGGFHLAQGTDRDGNNYVITKVETHPLLKPLIEFMKANGMTMPDHGMTPRTADQDELLKGHLAGEEEARETEQAFRERQTNALERMAGMIERSQHRKVNDPVLREHSQADVVDGEFIEQSDGTDG